MGVAMETPKAAAVLRAEEEATVHQVSILVARVEAHTAPLR
jgi:hypothetical protein